MLLTMRQLPQRSVRSLSLVSTTLYAALFPRLHRAIAFCARNEWALNVLDVGLFLEDCPNCRAGEILQHARQLTVKAPIHIARFHCCVYNSNFFPPTMSLRGLTLGSPHEPTAHGGFLDSLSSQIHQAFTRLESGILHSFQYVLRHCREEPQLTCSDGISGPASLPTSWMLEDTSCTIRIRSVVSL